MNVANWDREVAYLDRAVRDGCYVGFVICPKEELQAYVTMIKNKPYRTHVAEVHEQTPACFSISVGFPDNIGEDEREHYLKYLPPTAAL